MSDVIVVSPAADVAIETLRNNVAEASVRAYGAERDYAIALCSVLPAEWYSVEHRDTSADAKLVHAEKEGIVRCAQKGKPH